MNSLPVCDLFDDLKSALNTHNQLILEAPTGAGKSTALPLALLDWPEISGRIVMLEPRRVAARSVARFIASQRGSALGGEVGYRVRGDSKVSKDTRLEVVTEGILTRMIQDDPELSGVGLIIFDEIHERHLTTDLGLALALEVQAGLRDDLKIMAMSATLSGLPLHELMPQAAMLRSEGRSYPVTVEYAAAGGADYLEQMGRVLLELASGKRELPPDIAPGTVLAFLPGKAEIERVAGFLRERLSEQAFAICPLYGELDAKAQDLALGKDAQGRRKLVLATNVAESSLTIDGVTQVVDSGLVRQASFNPRSGVTRLGLKRISQASAIQRAGRAGRLAPGLCIRLWSQDEFERQMKADEPEILRSELVTLALEAAAWGARSFAELKLLSCPPRVNEKLAWALLKDLELVDEQHKLTALGRTAHTLGCHPRLAHMLQKAKLLGVSLNDANLAPLACVLAAILEGRGLPRRGADISQYLLWAQSGEAASQARQWLGKLNLSADLAAVARAAHPHDCGLLLALAYPDRIAMARGKEGFVLANGSGLTVDESDAMALESMLVAADFGEIEGRSAGRLWLGAPLDVRLFDGPLAFLKTERDVSGFDEGRGRFVAERQTQVGQLVLSRQTLAQVPAELRASAWIARLRQKGLGSLNIDEAAEQLRLRVTLAATLLGGDWPAMDDESLLENLESWLGPYLGEIKSLEQLAKLDLGRILRDSLDWQARTKLDEALPTHYPMATGTRAPIRYEADGRAMLRVRLQEAYGMADTPLLADGKLKLTMELLSPAQRPLALTGDLASFWQGPYQDVKKEMRGRYPRHLWPDDPANTLPTKFTKKKTLGQA
ncbi:ATP-dependent helicase HrpB [Shewanella sp. JM162201]|uniref:ATP-dependent helicase HrpB n=1 Tax=Shewanella jiangmenensis TaxID=2837387 RepID=A0ABS5V000_9GAMM|nr:ATP-dependent helicase HrpB [Shewanella jiangmenensis]MBT1443787.1 ATP-dependent helicase HrpB [Shewanella jiangmenensis]